MVMVRHDADSRARIARLEASRERGLWVAFTPTVIQGGAAETLDAASWGYYHYSQGVMRVEVFAKLDTAGTANNPILITGWPTAYNVAGGTGRAWRMAIGVFRLLDKSADDTFTGIATAYLDSIAGESDNLGGQVAFGQTGSLAAITLAIDDEITLSASWRV